MRYNLGQEGFAVEAYSDGAAGLLSARRDRPDLILLDVMLPGLTGNEVCKKLKADRNTEAIPIIFLTARSDEIDKMIGFEIGADDYVSKPFSPRELAARIKAVLRRAQAPPPVETVLSFGDLQVDFEKRQVLFRQTPIVLSALEFRHLLSPRLRSEPGLHSRRGARSRLERRVFCKPANRGCSHPQTTLQD